MRSLLVAIVLTASLAQAARAQTTAPTAGAPAPAAPAAVEKCKIVVLNLVGRGLAPGDAEIPVILTDSLAGEVGVVSRCDVVSQGDIVAMLDYERQKAVCTDGSDSCLAEVGQALGADRVVAGTIGKLGADFIITVRLMNVRKGAVDARAEEPVSTGPEQLRRASRNVGRRLFGAKDLPPGAEVDATPLMKPAEGAPLPGIFWAGTALAGVGVVAVVVGGGLAVLADARLGEAAESEKDDVQTEGLVALGIAGLGGALAVTGGILIGMAFME